MVVLRGETTSAERTATSAERSPDATPRCAREGAPGLFAHEPFEHEAAVQPSGRRPSRTRLAHTAGRSGGRCGRQCEGGGPSLLARRDRPAGADRGAAARPASATGRAARCRSTALARPSGPPGTGVGSARAAACRCSRGVTGKPVPTTDRPHDRPPGVSSGRPAARRAGTTTLASPLAAAAAKRRSRPRTTTLARCSRRAGARTGVRAGVLHRRRAGVRASVRRRRRGTGYEPAREVLALAADELSEEPAQCKYDPEEPE
jgi:hypothetical protein